MHLYSFANIIKLINFNQIVKNKNYHYYIITKLVYLVIIL